MSLEFKPIDSYNFSRQICQVVVQPKEYTEQDVVSSIEQLIKRAGLFFSAIKFDPNRGQKAIFTCLFPPKGTLDLEFGYIVRNEKPLIHKMQVFFLASCGRGGGTYASSSLVFIKCTDPNNRSITIPCMTRIIIQSCGKPLVSNNTKIEMFMINFSDNFFPKNCKIVHENKNSFSALQYLNDHSTLEDYSECFEKVRGEEEKRLIKPRKPEELHKVPMKKNKRTPLLLASIVIGLALSIFYQYRVKNV